jgi:hypothetical protein
MKLRASNAAADQNRQNSFLIDSNRLLYSRCQLGGPRAFRFLRDLRPWRDDRQVQERSDVAYWHQPDQPCRSEMSVVRGRPEVAGRGSNRRD